MISNFYSTNLIYSKINIFLNVKTIIKYSLNSILFKINKIKYFSNFSLIYDLFFNISKFDKKDTFNRSRNSVGLENTIFFLTVYLISLMLISFKFEGF